MSVNGVAQKTFQQYDSLTYSQLIHQDWKNLIRSGREAMKEKKDFYYLYYRMGVAYYNQKKFRMAQSFFEKAYQFNKFDDGLKESLFNTMKLNEHFDEAYHFSKKFSDSLAKKTATENLAFINQLDGTFAMNNPDSVSYSQEGIRNFPLYSKYIFGAGLNHRITRGFSVYHHYSCTSLNSSLYSFYQSHYFVQANILLIKHFTAQPSFGFIAQKTNFTDTRVNPVSNSYYILSLNLKKSFPLFDFKVAGSVSNFYSVNQLQFSCGIKIYPLFNNKISLGAEYLGLNQNSNLKSGLNFSGAIKPFSFLQINASYFKGDSLYNQNSENGFVLNNNSAFLKSRWNAGGSIFLPHKITLDLMYGVDSKTYFVYNPTTLQYVGAINYHYNFFSSSIKINF